MLINKQEACWGAKRNSWFPIGPGMGVNQNHWIRQKNLLLAVARSIGLLDSCRPRVHEGLSSIVYVLLVTISIVMTNDLGYAQSPVALQEATLPSSTNPHDGSTSIHEASDQMAPLSGDS
jgi:hypothetical protein